MMCFKRNFQLSTFYDTQFFEYGKAIQSTVYGFVMLDGSNVFFSPFLGQGASEKDTDQLYEQLTLALTWNRSDVAEEKIFNKDINWPESKYKKMDIGFNGIVLF